jgi:hypothetical protein
MEEEVDSPPTEEENILAKFDKISIVVYVTQVVLVYIVVIVSLYNLTTHPQEEGKLWTALLSSSLGVLLPAPRVKRNKNDVSDVTQ